MVARDVYHRHPDELSVEQLAHLREFIALAILESEEMREASE